MSLRSGWNMPPGCFRVPVDEAPCEVCGCDAEACLCPECPCCGETGNPACYAVAGGTGGHGLERTREQAAEAAAYEAMGPYTGPFASTDAKENYSPNPNPNPNINWIIISDRHGEIPTQESSQ